VQLRRARDEARGNESHSDAAAGALAHERERHVATQHAMAAAQLEVERLQQKLDWCILILIIILLLIIIIITTTTTTNMVYLYRAYH
jgi:hypothetical protein